MKNLNPKFSRRKLLLGAFQGTALLLLSGCEKIFDGLSRNDKVQSLLELAEHANLFFAARRNGDRLFAWPRRSDRRRDPRVRLSARGKTKAHRRSQCH